MKIPNIIQKLIENEFWPNKNNVDQQNIKQLVDFNLIKQIIPEEDNLYFYSPPFVTINRLLKRGDAFFLMPEVKDSLEQIDVNKTVLIGDFGIGSETELALNYSDSENYPSVIRLKWFYDYDNHLRWAKWVRVSDSFDEFARLAGLKVDENNQDYKHDNKIEYIIG